MTIVRAVVFDVDGTLAETEEIHRRSFNQAFREQGLDWEWDRPLYAELLATTGGRERILAYALSIGATVDAPAIHACKTRIYTERIRQGSVELRPGVAALIDRARVAGLALAIGTTTSRPNVVALLGATLGPGSEALFGSIRTGEDVRTKKPDPEVYRLVLQDLGLRGEECLCIEDSRNGLLAARSVGMRTVITPSIYSKGEDFTGADFILDDLSRLCASGKQSPHLSLIDQANAVSRLLNWIDAAATS